jgi:hypothetical protein
VKVETLDHSSTQTNNKQTFYCIWQQTNNSSCNIGHGKCFQIQFTHDPYIKVLCRNPKCTTEFHIDGAGGKEHKLVIWRGAVGVVEILGRSLRSPAVGVRRPRHHLLVGRDPPRRSSMLRRPLVVGAAPPRRPSVPHWPLMPHHPLAIGPAPSHLPSVLRRTPVVDGRPKRPWSVGPWSETSI